MEPCTGGAKDGLNNKTPHRKKSCGEFTRQSGSWGVVLVGSGAGHLPGPGMADRSYLPPFRGDRSFRDRFLCGLSESAFYIPGAKDNAGCLNLTRIYLPVSQALGHFEHTLCNVNSPVQELG